MPTKETPHTAKTKPVLWTANKSGRSLSEESVAQSAAKRNAALSRSLLPLMKDSHIALQYSPVTAEGLCKVDATQNPTNAYKVRGALASAELAKMEKKTTLVTASAGNHGAGIAFAAQLLGLKAIVYVPFNAPEKKVKAIQDFGAEVRFAGNSFDECLAQARLECEQMSDTAKFVHPFDDPTVVAGQGTIGYELLDKVTEELRHQAWEKVRVVLPIGGGGLAAGVVSVLKTQWPKHFPPLEVVGVVDESSPASLLAMLRGRQVRVMSDTIADGTRVEMVGNHFLEVAHHLDALALLPHDDLVNAMQTHKEETGRELEGAGALALGGEEALRAYGLRRDPKKTLSMVLLTGTNIDSERFEEEVSAERRMNKELRQRLGFDVLIPEQRGQLHKFLETVRDFNIASLTYMKRVESAEGHLRVEFEVPRTQAQALAEAIKGNFPGSEELPPGEAMVYEGGIKGTEAGTETLITLEDRPGSFLECIKEWTASNKLGSVDFLFYRQPAKEGAKAQVVMGVAADAVDEARYSTNVPLPRLH